MCNETDRAGPGSLVHIDARESLRRNEEAEARLFSELFADWLAGKGAELQSASPLAVRRRGVYGAAEDAPPGYRLTRVKARGEMKKPKPRLPRELFADWLPGEGRCSKALTHWPSGGEEACVWRRGIRRSGLGLGLGLGLGWGRRRSWRLACEARARWCCGAAR